MVDGDLIVDDDVGGCVGVGRRWKVAGRGTRGANSIYVSVSYRYRVRRLADNRE